MCCGRQNTKQWVMKDEEEDGRAKIADDPGTQFGGGRARGEFPTHVQFAREHSQHVDVKNCISTPHLYVRL